MPGSQPSPAVATALPDLCLNVIRPMILPGPAEFTQPLLDSFVAAHDKLSEDSTIFTARTRLREVALEFDGIVREFRRQENVRASQGDAEGEAGDEASLDALRKLRLRARLQAQAGANASMSDTAEKIRRDADECIRKIDAEMKKEEEEIMRSFKEGLRKTVSAS